MNDIISFFSSFYIFVIIISLLGYLFGSVNFSIILTKHSGKTDIRKMGSGNAGFTNMLRSVGKKQAVITFIGDFVKAVIAILAVTLIMSAVTEKAEYISAAKYICGLFCVVGHMFPLYFGFRGGKGVVTGAAVILMCDYRAFLIVVAVFLIVFMFSKIISLSSLCAASSFFVSSLCFALFEIFSDGNYSAIYVSAMIFASFIITLLVIIRHKDNIIRLKNGEEKKITVKK